LFITPEHRKCNLWRNPRANKGYISAPWADGCSRQAGKNVTLVGRRVTLRVTDSSFRINVVTLVTLVTLDSKILTENIKNVVRMAWWWWWWW
jgi:hypothetical protein